MREPLIWIHPFSDSARILIEPAVLTTVLNFRQDTTYKMEAGGILLGYRREDHLHVVEATTPQPKDKRSLFRFFRSDPYHQNIAIRRWIESHTMIDYLGEWHTHPEISPSPSSLDISEWRLICHRKHSSMVFMIAGMDSSLWVGAGFGDNIFKANMQNEEL